MAYYRGKDIEKSGGNAMQEVILEKRSIAQVARRFGKVYLESDSEILHHYHFVPS